MKNIFQLTVLASVIGLCICFDTYAMNNVKAAERLQKNQLRNKINSNQSMWRAHLKQKTEECEIAPYDIDLDGVYDKVLCLCTRTRGPLVFWAKLSINNGTFDLAQFLYQFHVKDKEIAIILDLMEALGDKGGRGFGKYLQNFLNK